jgi:SAM-dependent methyltransferase
MKNLEYIGIDLYPRRNIKLLMDLVQTPICSDSIDTAICIHVLEHIEKDRTALQEIYRVLKPRGWVLISVPIRLEESTFEDPSIKTPEARQLAFGETGHVRFYGIDLKDRLEETGFKVHLEVGKDIDKEEMNKYGLLDDENIFFCTKP